MVSKICACRLVPTCSLPLSHSLLYTTTDMLIISSATPLAEPEATLPILAPEVARDVWGDGRSTAIPPKAHHEYV